LIDIKSYTLSELEALILSWGEPKFRAIQLYKWLQAKQATSFREMSDLSKAFRAKLEETCFLPKLQVIDRLTDETEGTIKYLIELADGEKIEAVYMPQDERRTLCVSTQVGCKFNCAMCLTGSMGFKRNLTASEILEQIDTICREQHDLTNIVFMGMGEPLDNFEALSLVLTLLSDPDGRCFSLRRVTVSTIGLIDKVAELFQLGLIPNITFSLNATTEETRAKLMPVNKKVSAQRGFKSPPGITIAPRRRFTIAYVLLAGINDSIEDAKRLAKLLPQDRVKINLIPFNRTRD